MIPVVNVKELDPDASPEANWGARLRRHRLAQGWSQEETGRRMAYSAQHISALETGRKKPTLQVARRADVAFGTGDEFERAYEKVRNAGLLAGFPQFIEHEGEAVEIRLYEVGVIPGLLQTVEYATANAESEVKRGAITREQAEERIRLVEERQEALKRAPAPHVFAVLDEGCLLRPMGGPEVMRRQYDRLLEFAEQPNAVLQVAPFSMGDRRPLNLPITLLTLPDRSLVLYAESADRGHLERDSAYVMPLLTAYHQLQRHALSPTESVDYIRKLRKGTT
ncbi:helix-turn-helix transcriptional regulator [Streptomyces sp. LP05-1]|uniref:Helix-turn-helix transcriptional regulator n=1 Tax=Streptomyces pyxinae TaxID=2970734 RepID=A0ABT2CR07_9ACTN|nr:helix-turn-helix transcriptional regulator [Streptomyces sp. LP05-1]MCS0639877.1 helix-turn-helix transcriptional regulator [Streptomyces sp. LP05-1]